MTYDARIRDDNLILRTFTQERILVYLQQVGWTLRDADERAFLLWQVCDKELVEIILPKKTTLPDYPLYAADAINIAAAVKGVSSEAVLWEVVGADQITLRKPERL